MKALITTVSVERVGSHDHVHIWSRGGKGGVLIVEEGDGAFIANRLFRGSDCDHCGDPTTTTTTENGIEVIIDADS